MTPPGDPILLITLLTLFLACCGYYAGRAHHRHQAEAEREEAYRDGYETATRSVFSLAARVIGPRRSGHRSAVPAQAVPAAQEREPEPKPGPTKLIDSPPVGFPAPPPPPPHVVAEPPAPGGVNYQPFPAPRPAEAVEPPPAPVAEEEPDDEPAGRHLVPDALIEGTTYRLPPDRVFRAKVAGATLPDDPTTRIAVPKPRES